MLSYAAWQKRYAGSAAVLGQTVTLNGEANVIIGVLPRDFHFAAEGESEFWSRAAHHHPTPVTRSAAATVSTALARLRDGVSVETADANIKLIARELEKQYSSNRGQGGAVISLTELEVGRIRPILIVLLCGAGLLLLIACVNVTSLVLVRAESRRREMAVRSALGGSRARLVSQFVTEAVVLVGAAAALGLVSARWLMRLLLGLIGAGSDGRHAVSLRLGLNLRVLAFAAAVSVGAAAAILHRAGMAIVLARYPRRPGRRQPRLVGHYLAPLWRQPGGAGTGHRRGAAGWRGTAGPRASTGCCTWIWGCSRTIWRRCA